MQSFEISGFNSNNLSADKTPPLSTIHIMYCGWEQYACDYFLWCL